MKTEHEQLAASSSTPDANGGHFAELVQLEVMIEAASNSTNEYLTRSLMEKYTLLEHLRALKRFLLLGQVSDSADRNSARVNHSPADLVAQGDFIQYLMDLLGPELSKRGASVYRHTLTNVLETALNASNAKFEVHLDL